MQKILNIAYTTKTETKIIENTKSHAKVLLMNY